MGGATPEQRADMVVRKLEQAIRDNRQTLPSPNGKKGASGMSLSKWQDVARVEITSAIRNAQREKTSESWMVNRLLMGTGAAVTALGFLGTVFSSGGGHRQLAAYVAVGVGLIFLMLGCEWPITKNRAKKKAEKRAKQLAKLNDLDKQIKRMEAHLENKKNIMKNEML